MTKIRATQSIRRIAVNGELQRTWNETYVTPIVKESSRQTSKEPRRTNQFLSEISKVRPPESKLE